MKAVIVSDTHGLEEILRLVYERHKGEADLFIHCGDSELTKDHPYLAPYQIVKGNVDFLDSGFPDQLLTEIGGLKWLVVHGHLDGVNQSLLNLSYKAEAIGANVICFGHIHRVVTEEHQGKLFINPGSLRSPRDRLEKTYCVCDWTEGDPGISVTYFTDQGEKIQSLSQTNLLLG